LRAMLFIEGTREKGVQSLQRDLFCRGIAGRAGETYNHAVEEEAESFASHLRCQFVAPAGAVEQAALRLLQPLEQRWLEQRCVVERGGAPRAPRPACLETIENEHDLSGTAARHRPAQE